MDRLPALRSLAFGHGPARRLFGSGVTLRRNLADETSSYRASILALVGHKIESLDLVSFSPADTVALIRTFPNLSRLGLFNLGEPEEDDHLDQVASAISSLRQLRNLDLEMEEGSTWVWPVESLAPLARDPPPVVSLYLANFPLNHHTLHLVAIFSPLVDFVTLGVIDQDPATDLSSISPIRLPSLQILSLVASPAHLPQLFRILKCTSTLSDFCHYSDPNDALVPTDPALLTFLDLYPSLRHVWLWNVNFEGPPGVETPAALIPSPSFLAAYAKVVHSRGLDPGVLMEHYLSPFHRHAKLDYTENEAARLKDALGRTLDFGKSELERMFAEGSIARAVGWVGKLKALEDERLAWKD